MMFYTGVGARITPQNILNIMERIAYVLKKQEYILRSGGAKGADSAFEAGAGDKKEIFYAKDATEEAMTIASRVHPAWGRCSPYVRMLHARNAFQILGRDLNTPSIGLICWTPDGCISHADRTRDTGGTGTAISIANLYGVPVSNLCRVEHFNKWVSYIDKHM